MIYNEWMYDKEYSHKLYNKGTKYNKDKFYEKMMEYNFWCDKWNCSRMMNNNINDMSEILCDNISYGDGDI